MEEEEKQDYIDIIQAAKLTCVTPQAIYSAIKKHGLPAVKKGQKWWVSLEDLKQYKKHRYSREKKRLNGEFIFNKEKGLFSVNDATMMISHLTGLPFSPQQTYYFARIGRLKASRVGWSWVIGKEAIEEFVKQFQSKEENISAKII